MVVIMYRFIFYDFFRGNCNKVKIMDVFIKVMLIVYIGMVKYVKKIVF